MLEPALAVAETQDADGLMNYGPASYAPPKA